MAQPDIAMYFYGCGELGGIYDSLRSTTLVRHANVRGREEIARLGTSFVVSALQRVRPRFGIARARLIASALRSRGNRFANNERVTLCDFAILCRRIDRRHETPRRDASRAAEAARASRVRAISSSNWDAQLLVE